jgi:hypothetical protein
VELEVVVRNALPAAADASVRLVLPPGWSADPDLGHAAGLPARSERRIAFRVRAGQQPVRRARIGADITIGTTRLGQLAEALVTVR